MPFEQYHEPAEELPPEIRSFARMIVSLGEEADAMNWYEQRISVERDNDAREIMENAQTEEFKHFLMDLEWILRRKPKFLELAKRILFTEGNIVENGEAAEEAVIE